MTRRESSLPEIFQLYFSKVQYVQRVSDKEFSSTCPTCGGSVHPSGEWPDRCRWFVDDNCLGWCRKCSSVFWPDADGVRPLSPEKLAQFRQAQIEREEARKRSAERALAHLQDERVWERYHAQLDDAGKQYWRDRGIPDAFQTWWKFGWDFGHRFGPHVTDTATIPLYDQEWDVRNVKHRLIVPGTSGKYRYEIAGQGQPPFLCNPDAAFDGHLFLVEGEIKAAVTFARLDDSSLAMVGLPGSKVSDDALKIAEDAGRITLVMDPGAREEAWDICKRLGPARCRVLILHQKIDDGIIAAGMTKRDVQHLLAGAIPAKAR